MTTATAATPSTAVFDFDPDFQTMLATFAVRDPKFNQQTDGLIRPEYFEDETEQLLVAITQDYWTKHRLIPGIPVLGQMIKDAIVAKRVRGDVAPDVMAKLRSMVAAVQDPKFFHDRDHAVEKAAEFAKNQAISDAILQSAELVDKRSYAKIEELIKKAMMVGVRQDETKYDYWEMAGRRKEIRRDRMAGILKPTGITTGVKEIDEVLYHKGWGRKELSVLMGPAKAGKSMTLITFSANAALAGHNVLFITLEVSDEIVADRLDANISDTELTSLETHMAIVNDRVTKKHATAGKYLIHAFPSGTFKPGDLRRLLASYRAQGITFDMVVVDYADLMAPDRYNQDVIENSRTIYVDLRAIAQEEDCAMLSATQTNRGGFKAAVGKMEDVASDINKARTVDLLISLNQTDEEKAIGEARLYFAGSRNQKGNISVKVKSNLSKAKYIERFLEIE